ncbi:hypothetical protein P691DRAFT_678024, partial [Macrolepiota fuliginosa MF-IS2]
KCSLVFSEQKRMLYRHSYLGCGCGPGGMLSSLPTCIPSTRTAPSREDSNLVHHLRLAHGARRVVEIEDEWSFAERRVIMGGDDITSAHSDERFPQSANLSHARSTAYVGLPFLIPSLLDTFPSRKVPRLSYLYGHIFPLLSVRLIQV